MWTPTIECHEPWLCMGWQLWRWFSELRLRNVLSVRATQEGGAMVVAVDVRSTVMRML
jgi:hypothetical protein